MTRRAVDRSFFWILTPILAMGLLGAAPTAVFAGQRTIKGHGVRFAVPAGAAKSSFKQMSDGRFVYTTETHVTGLGRLTVAVGPRGDPEATLSNELYGVQANARTKMFRKSQVHTIGINRGKGVQAEVRGEGGKPVAWCITWTKRRQFELSLESRRGGSSPLGHPVWRALVSSLRSDEAPLK